MAELNESNDPLQSQLQAGFELPAEKKMYFNGFTLAVTPSDVVIVLQQNNQPVALLNTSYVIAKTLVIKLGDLLKNFEEKTEQPILTLDQINSAVSKEA
jgi:hypothetical protein